MHTGLLEKVYVSILICIFFSVSGKPSISDALLCIFECGVCEDLALIYVLPKFVSMACLRLVALNAFSTIKD